MAIKSETSQMSSLNQNDSYQQYQLQAYHHQQPQQPTLPPYFYCYDNNRVQDEIIHALNPNTVSPTDTISYTSNNNYDNTIHIKADQQQIHPSIMQQQGIITSLVPQINQHANYPYLQNNLHNNNELIEPNVQRDIFNAFNTNNNSYVQPFGSNHNNNNNNNFDRNRFMFSSNYNTNCNQFSSSQQLFPYHSSAAISNNTIIPTAAHVTNCVNNMVNAPNISLQNMPNVTNIINENGGDKKQRVEKKKRKKKIVSNDDKPFECLTCGKRYKHLCNFRSHSKIHTDNAYICEYCNKKFGRKANWEEHRRVHTGESPFICKFCNRKFKQRHGWKDHVRTHTKNKIYSCSKCNKEFDAGYKLHNHMRIHNPKKKK